MAAHRAGACVLALTAGLGTVLGGCSSNSESKFMELPDLATHSPSKQQVMSPADQKKAIDELIAQRDKQAAATPAAK